MRFFILFLSLFAYSLTAQTVLLDEDFNDCNLPDDWTVELTGNPDAVWYISDEIDNENSDGGTIDGSCMLVFDDDATGNGTPDWNLKLTTPAFDGTQYSTLNFSADIHFRQYEGSYLRISVFDGTEFVSVAEWSGGINTGEQFDEYVTFTADLSFYANENMQIQFEFDDGQDWVWWAGVDNVFLTGEGDAENIVLSDFNSCEMPAGWSTVLFTGEDDWQFGTHEDGSDPQNSMNGTCFAFFDDDGIGQEAPFSSVGLISPPFSGTDFADIYLDFDVILRRYTDTEHLGIYIFDGEEAVNIVNYFTDLGGPDFNEYVHERIDLSPFRQETMRVVFLYDDGDDWGWWVGIDNVKISGSGSLNDLCENALDISLNQPCLAGNNQNALFLGDQPSCDNRNEGALWYKYLALNNGLTEIVTNADYNDIITVFTGNCAAMTEVACYDADEQGFTGENLFFPTAAFTEYYIRVSGKRADFGVPRGNLCMELKAAAAYPTPPANDACAAAVPLSIDGACAESNNYNADFDGDVPTLNTLSRADIWYKFTAGNEPIEIISHADFADVLTVFAGNCSALTEVAGTDAGRRLEVTDLTPGTEYLLQISGFFSTVEGNVCAEINTVSEETPDNDNCISAQTLTVGADCQTGYNAGATASDPRPGCETEYDASVWYEFITPSSGSVKLNTDADFVHSVSIYAGICADLEEVYCTNNPLSCDGYFKVGSLIPGDTYYLQIASTSNHLGFLETGNFCLHLIDGEEMTAPPLTLTAGVDCTGEGTGVLSFTASGGSGIYTFQGTPEGQTLITGNNYMVIVTDSEGCEVSASGTANCGEVSCLLSADISSLHISCYGETDGTAAVDISDATGSPGILWSTGATTAQINDLPAGTYEVTVTDETGCSVILGIPVYEPAELVNTLTATDETAYEANDGIVNTAVSGGTPPYTYTWSNGSTAAAQNGLPPGNYTVTITDNNGCQTVQSAVVAAFTCAATANISEQNISCHGAADGTASINFTNGNAPYTYQWSNGATDAAINNLAPGTYSVTATDADDCPVVLSTVISQPDPLTAEVTAAGETGAGANNGTAAANPAGGIAPYIFLWSNAAQTAEITDLAPGNYTVTVTDANDCTTVQTVTVNAFNCSLSASVSTSAVSCFGGNDGTAAVNAAGGTTPYTYAWSSGGSDETETGLSAGTYEVTVTDGADCPAVISFTVGTPSELTLTLSAQQNPTCVFEATGSLNVASQGGTGAYTYLWADGATTAERENLAAGTYAVTVTDANGCTTADSYEITAEDNINPVTSTQDLTIYLDGEAAAVITPEAVNNGSFDNCEEITLHLSQTDFGCADLGANTVTLTVQDAAGNESSATALITVVDEIAPVITCPESFTADCSGYAEYALPTVTDNCTPNNPMLLEGLGSGIFFPAGENTETYAVSDAAGNIVTCSFVITVANALSVNVEVEKPTCNGDADGSATAYVIGSDDVTYQWNDPQMQTSATASGLSAGSYQVVITDAEGCSVTQDVVVPEPDALQINILEVNDDMNNTGSGSISVAVTGGEMPYTYNWTLNGEFFSDAAGLSNLSAGIYQLLITDANDCIINSESIIVDSQTSVTDVSALSRYFDIFPNPTTGRFFVRVNLPHSEEVSLTVYDAAGKEIEVRAAQRLQSELLTFDLSRFAGGVYEVRAIVGDEVAVFKVVKL